VAWARQQAQFLQQRRFDMLDLDHLNRDREVPHGFPPPTPPGIGVPTMAVRYG
jgi:hypothetical protein